ncbi:MarR family winged helix-turn-helix transcriptional regulator [Micromonospora parva]|uniref:MarR family winged helix-turn-helix transcriptional regulator n=1 Tax=Micromonospora parva TaxID=1464048 RepID=UPI0004C14105|nr:MarR family winged helix-turn-helix transcriptional regulator [Micromonospora parva]
MESDAGELGLRLYDLVRSVRLLKQRRADEHPAIPAGMLGMLVQIEQLSGDCHARDLAERIRLDASTVSRSVAALVAHGLVERRPDPTDKRATILAVTPAGRAALADSHRWYGEVLERALADWTPGEVAALSAALGRFTGDIEIALGNNDNDNLEAAR